MYKGFLRILYPQRCPICLKVVSGNIKVCNICRDRLIYANKNTCETCGKVLKSNQDVLCLDCRKKDRNFDKGISVFFYNDAIKESIINFKYHNKREFATYYANEISSLIKKEYKNLNIDMMLPVPIHKSREIKRGYNQTEELCKEINKIMHIPYRSDILIRNKKTKALKEMTKLERFNMLKEAFEININDDEKALYIKNKTLLVVDDIYTTGSTMDAISMLLKKAGAKTVVFITIATGSGI